MYSPSSSTLPVYIGIANGKPNREKIQVREGWRRMDLNHERISRRGFLSSASSGVLLAAATAGSAPAEYPLIRVAGSHREMGRQHGEQATGKIKAHLDRITSDDRLSRQQLRE